MFGPIPRTPAIFLYQARFSAEEAKKATPEPAWVILEVELMYQKRFGLPAAAAISSTFGFSGNSSVSVWTA